MSWKHEMYIKSNFLVSVRFYSYKDKTSTWKVKSSNGFILFSHNWPIVRYSHDLRSKNHEDKGHRNSSTKQYTGPWSALTEAHITLDTQRSRSIWQPWIALSNLLPFRKQSKGNDSPITTVNNTHKKKAFWLNLFTHGI